MGDRVKQHLPRKLINSEQKGADPDNEQQPVSARTRSHGTPEEVLFITAILEILVSY